MSIGWKKLYARQITWIIQEAVNERRKQWAEYEQIQEPTGFIQKDFHLWLTLHGVRSNKARVLIFERLEGWRRSARFQGALRSMVISSPGLTGKNKKS